MQIYFQTDYLRLLFSDKYFKDEIGIRATQSYRLVVNYLFSISSLDNLYAAKFLDFSENPVCSVKIDNKRRLQLDIQEKQITLIALLESK